MHVVLIIANMVVEVIVIEIKCLQNCSSHFCNFSNIQSQTHFKSGDFHGLSSLPFIVMGLQDGKILTLERKQVKLCSFTLVHYVIVRC